MYVNSVSPTPIASFCVALAKECWCFPVLFADRCATFPENGAGLVPTQFHASLPLTTAPAGSTSSTHTVSAAWTGAMSSGKPAAKNSIASTGARNASNVRNMSGFLLESHGLQRALKGDTLQWCQRNSARRGAADDA